MVHLSPVTVLSLCPLQLSCLHWSTWQGQRVLQVHNGALWWHGYLPPHHWLFECASSVFSSTSFWVREGWGDLFLECCFVLYSIVDVFTENPPDPTQLICVLLQTELAGIAYIESVHSSSLLSRYPTVAVCSPSSRWSSTPLLSSPQPSPLTCSPLLQLVSKPSTTWLYSPSGSCK